jgi:putative flavoprotein involved in K+ transport
VTNEAGVHFLGLPWLHKWKSAFLFGVGEDAEYLAAHVCGKRSRASPEVCAVPR